jgi:predicted dehydrogenase
MSKSISRRSFVGDLGAAGLFTIVPRHVLGRGFRAPSDTLNVACIGVGGMGASDVRGMAGENIYALCDVDDNQAAATFGAYPKAKRFRDYRVMFEREGKNIDAVTVSTPDHTHAAAALMALGRKKPVYVQKPLARTIGEVRALMDAARAARVATQMGNQGHAGEGTRQIREWVEAGAIGTVREVHYWTNRPIWPQGLDRPTQMHNVPPWLDWDVWLGPARERPFHPAYLPFRWRGWWDFGTGALGDMACHGMDAAFWTLGLGHPSRVEPESTRVFSETAPAGSRIAYDFPARGSRPAVKVVWRDGSLLPPRPPEVLAEASWPPSDDGGQLWIGDDGKLVAGVLGQDPRLLNEARDAEIRAKPPEVKYPRVESVYAEWIAACKGGPPAGSSFVEHAGPLTEMVLLGVLAARFGRPLEVNPATGQVTTAGIPEDWIVPQYRKGWGEVRPGRAA